MSKKNKKGGIAQRNAFALPAKMRQNAGAMIHSNPPRETVAIVFRTCRWCGQPMDVDDDSGVCLDCELESGEPAEDLSDDNAPAGDLPDDK